MTVLNGPAGLIPASDFDGQPGRTELIVPVCAKAHRQVELVAPPWSRFTAPNPGLAQWSKRHTTVVAKMASQDCTASLSLLITVIAPAHMRCRSLARGPDCPPSRRPVPFATSFAHYVEISLHSWCLAGRCLGRFSETICSLRARTAPLTHACVLAKAPRGRDQEIIG